MAEILVIDDDEDLRGVLQAALAGRGHQVRSLDGGDCALEILASGEIELLIVDEIMPGLHGSDLLQALRKHGNDVPAILMTGLGTRTFIEPMKQLGALVVPKPAAGSGELIKDLFLAVDESLKGEAEIVEMVGRTVKQALKLGKTAPYLRWLLDCELRVQISAAVNHDAEKVKQILGEAQGVAQLENSIRLKGEIWHLRHDGESSDYPRKGNQSLVWLRKLLAAPNKLFTVAELQGDPDGKLAADAKMGSERETDDAGIKKIKDRLEEIAEISDETGGSESLDNEKLDLLNRLDQARRGKKIDSPLKAAHRNIAVQLRAVRDNKLAKDMPRLAAHLRASLKMEFPYIGYYPVPGTLGWQF
jgi:CheY-like chemotaxis protein